MRTKIPGQICNKSIKYPSVSFSFVLAQSMDGRAGLRVWIEFKPNKTLNLQYDWNYECDLSMAMCVCVCVCEIICLSSRCSSLSSMKSHVFHDTQISLLFRFFTRSQSLCECGKKKKDRKTNQRLNTKQSTFHLAFWSNRVLLHLNSQMQFSFKAVHRLSRRWCRRRQ